MAEEAAPATGEEATETPAADAAVKQAENPDAVRRLIDSERSRAKSAEQKVSELQTRLTEFEDAHKSDLEKTQEELGRVKPEAERLAQENMRLLVAIEKGLPRELAGRLQGSSKDELEKDADQLVSLTQGAAAQGFDHGARSSTPVGNDMNSLLRRAAGRA